MRTNPPDRHDYAHPARSPGASGPPSSQIAAYLAIVAARAAADAADAADAAPQPPGAAGQTDAAPASPGGNPPTPTDNVLPAADAGPPADADATSPATVKPSWLDQADAAREPWEHDDAPDAKRRRRRDAATRTTRRTSAQAAREAKQLRETANTHVHFPIQQPVPNTEPGSRLAACGGDRAGIIAQLQRDQYKRQWQTARTVADKPHSLSLFEAEATNTPNLFQEEAC